MTEVAGDQLKVGDIISFTMNGSPQGVVYEINNTHILVRWNNGGMFCWYRIANVWEIIDDGE